MAQEQNWGKVIAKAWSDENFKQQLMQNPRGTLETYGIKIQEKVQIKMHENTPSTFHIVIPTKPQGELTEEKLHSIAAGMSCQGGTYQ